MKKNIFKTLICLTLIAFVGSCSSEDSVQMNESEKGSFSAKSGVWDGVIGEDRSGTFYVTGNKAGMIADLEQSMASLGSPVTISNLSIVEQTAANDPNDKGHMLIATGSANTSIGIMLTKTAGQFIIQRPQNQSFVRTVCKGCASGCNLKYYTIDDYRLPYCEENGCVYDCEKLQFD